MQRDDGGGGEDESGGAVRGGGEQSPLSQRTKSKPRRQRPLAQFPVTKLRSWRTGYVRWLVLYEKDFGTIDPTTATGDNASSMERKETNRWPYSALSEWMAVPNETDTILLQVETEKLKFSCSHHSRSAVLTALLKQQDLSGQSSANVQHHPLFFAAQRWKRTQQHQSVLLQVLPYGVAELHSETRRRLQTYLYQDMSAVSFPAADTLHNRDAAASAQQYQHQHGIFLHFHQLGKVLLYTVADGASTKGGGGNATSVSGIVVGSGRTALYKAMQEHCGVLGLDPPLSMAPSFTVSTWLEQQRQRHVHTGVTAMAWNVTKQSSHRHDDDTYRTISSRSMSYTSGNMEYSTNAVSRQLIVTGKGFLVERDAVGIVSMRRLHDLYAIVRDPVHSVFTVEFTNGSCTTYSVSRHRDAIIVSILDAAMQLGQNSTVHITDVPSASYCLTSTHDSEQGDAMPKGGRITTAAAGIFQPTPVSLYTLKRVYAIATHIFALVSGEFALPQQSAAHRHEQEEFARNLADTAECDALVEACREFNASVQHAATELSGISSVDKYIVGTMGALFGLLCKLLQKDGSGAIALNSCSRHAKENVASALFQTLHRLTKTMTGYKCSADLTTLRDCLPSLWGIEDTFCKFGAYSVLNALLSGTNKDNPSVKRDMEAEYVNKNVLLKSGGRSMLDGLVSSLLPADDSQSATQREVSDLILMVTSDILQSLLCSYYDTTSPEHFHAFIGALAHRYRALLSTLRSPTPFVLENTALLLHLLSTHAPSSTAAIRDAALSSAILLQHFYAATFSPLEGQRFLSRYLCSLWLSGPMNCDEKRLLKRMVPHGFLAYLNMPVLSRMEEGQLDELERDAVEENITDQGAAAEAALAAQSNDNPISVLLQREAATSAGGTNTARLRSRIVLATATAVNMGQQQQSKENFRIFFHVLTQDHSLADLIWSQQTRRELRIALESELEYVRREIEARGINAVAWNHQQFHVKYPSLDNEVKVGDVYMRLWLQAGDAFIRSWDEPGRLFEHLFRRFLCEVDRDEKVSCTVCACVDKSCSSFAIFARHNGLYLISSVS